VSLPSKAKLDHLGSRLRGGEYGDDDLRLLDTFRRSFASGYEQVLTTIRDNLELEPTGRPAKSTSSIIEKLRRETIRLTQIQDIAGCRVLVPDALTQEAVIERLAAALEKVTVVDRRVLSSHGYRAVHVVALSDGKPIEIQVRTALQHLWAELSEKLADVIDPTVKYGGGPKAIQDLLRNFSELVREFEGLEVEPGPSERGRMDALKQDIWTLIEQTTLSWERR